MRLGVVFLWWLICFLFFFFVLFFKPHLQADLWHLATRTCGAWWCRYRGHWTHIPTCPDNDGLFKSLHNNLFLPGFSSSPGWLLVTRTRGVWWCRYRGHWRSGPRHLSPRSRVCAHEWHCKDIHSHIHSHTPMHTPNLTKSETLNSPNMTPSIGCPFPVQCWW